MQIVRLRADANLNVVTHAVRALNPERGAHNRFAVVKATVGEEERAFLVSASKTDKDVGLLKTAAAGKQLILSTKDASGNDVRVTGKVDGYYEIGSATARRLNIIATAAGLSTAGYVGLATAVHGFADTFHTSPWFAAVAGIASLYGAVVAFGANIVKADGIDWPRETLATLRDGQPVPVEIHGIEQAPAPIAALPAPAESPFVIPPVTLPVRDKVPAQAD